MEKTKKSDKEKKSNINFGWKGNIFIFFLFNRYPFDITNQGKEVESAETTFCHQWNIDDQSGRIEFGPASKGPGV